MKKVIFIDRDGTILCEPADEQIDSFEKMFFVPGAISALRSIAALDYELVLASNQDGLGTPAFPEETFRPVHDKMLSILAGEGIRFDDQLIDRSFPEANAPTRKPRTGMFGKYLGGGYDLAASFVIGDRDTDAQLAANLGCRFLRIDSPAAESLSISPAESLSGAASQTSPAESLPGIASQTSPAESLPGTASQTSPAESLPGTALQTSPAESLSGTALQTSPAESLPGTALQTPSPDPLAKAAASWQAAAEEVRRSDRSATVVRKTSETDIEIRVDLDGKGESAIDTGLKFFDHMLDQLVHHGGLSLVIRCKGDLQVDEHHTMEDVGIALGDTLLKALGNKAGIARYGFVLPMDESEAQVLLDLGGRCDFAWDVPFTREYIGDTPTEMFKHFFKSLSDALHCNLHIKAQGENNHHLIEGVFKAFARTLRQAVARNVYSGALPSSKGSL